MRLLVEDRFAMIAVEGFIVNRELFWWKYLLQNNDIFGKVFFFFEGGQICWIIIEKGVGIFEEATTEGEINILKEEIYAKDIEWWLSNTDTILRASVFYS